MRKIGSWALLQALERRTEPCLNGAESLQQNHRAATVRATPERRRGITYGSRCVGWGGLARDSEQLAAEWQQGRTAPVGKQPEVPDSDESIEPYQVGVIRQLAPRRGRANGANGVPPHCCRGDSPRISILQ